MMNCPKYEGGGIPPAPKPPNMDKMPKVDFAMMVHQMEEMDRQRLRGLGVTSFMDNSVVHPNGKVITRLNLSMLHDNKITPEQLSQIKAIHVRRYDLLEAIQANPSKEKALEFEKLELDLQQAWGREPKKSEIRFWQLPGCTCPKHENVVKYPAEDYVIDPKCPLHGE